MQTRVAASFERDAEGEQLALRGYGVGDKLRWHPKTDTRYHRWREGGDAKDGNADAADDEVQVTCSNCRAEIRVLLGFESTYFVGVLEILGWTS